jgi:hypothetical protein
MATPINFTLNYTAGTDVTCHKCTIKGYKASWWTELKNIANAKRFMSKWHDAQPQRKSSPYYTVSAGNRMQLLVKERMSLDQPKDTSCTYAIILSFVPGHKLQTKLSDKIVKLLPC